MVDTWGTLPSSTEHLGDSFFQDPQGLFARLRSSAPVTPVITPEGVRAWLVTRYDDVRAALADPRLAKDWVTHMTPEDFDINVDPVQAFLDVHMLNVDPPDHTRLRRLVLKAFTPGRATSLQPRMIAVTDELLDAMEQGPAETELIEAYAFPMSVTVICELIGVPVADRESFRAWSDTVLSSRGTRAETRAAAEAMHGYFAHLVAERRRAPADDLLSALIAARDSGDSLTENELHSMLFLLLVAGHETMVNLIAGGVLALLLNPAELKRVRDDPSLLPAAIEELLRFANPLNHATERFTLEPVTIGGIEIPAREWVMLATSSANRDPGRFDDGDRLDVGRDTSGHLGFGHGIHYCLGAPMARLEGEIAFGRLLARFPDLALAVPESSLRWRPSSLIHGLETLPVRLR